MTDIQLHPVQARFKPGHSAKLRTEVTLRAYEVYCHLYREQEALITGNCRGGFSAGELIGFLYAHTFPKSEWKSRVDEAFEGMDI